MDGSNHARQLASLEDPPGDSPAPGHRLGRRPLPEDLRTEPFSLRLTETERRVIASAAARAGARATATWARAVLVEAARRFAEGPPSTPDPDHRGPADRA